LGKYHPKSLEEQRITKSIIKDLIICESLPVTFVESDGFRKFLQIVIPRFVPIGRTAVISKIHDQAAKLKEDIISVLNKCDTVNATVDIWSDRQTRSFFGITAHVMVEDDSLQLRTYTLACERILGRHTGEKISNVFDGIMEEFQIKNKIDYIVTDNASNMKSAFTTIFPVAEIGNPIMVEVGCELSEMELDALCSLDDESVWNSLEESESDSIDIDLCSIAKRSRLSCFAHSLQLSIGDGLKHIQGARPAMSKLSRLSTLIHSSNAVKENFENKFGKSRTIPAYNATRWNSQLHQIQSAVCLDHQKLENLCKDTDHRECILSVKEWAQMKELVDLLKPFSEATNLIQGDTNPTISFVVPTVLALHGHLTSFMKKAKFLKVIATELLKSLKLRFSGVFASVGMCNALPAHSMLHNLGNEQPFGDVVYVMAAVLDPAFSFRWLVDVAADDVAKEDLKTTIKDVIVQEAESLSRASTLGNISPSESEGQCSSIDPGSATLFASYKRKKLTRISSAHSQVIRYLELAEETEEMCLGFWYANKARLDLIFGLAKKVLAVPASSAPVERVFSRGGIIMRPHRARLNDKLLAELIFLKCNYQYM